MQEKKVASNRQNRHDQSTQAVGLSIPRSKKPVHGLVRQLHPQKRRRVRRHRPRHRRPHARKEGLEPPSPIHLAHHLAHPIRLPLLGPLNPTLDGVDGKDGNPHGHARGPARRHDGRQAQLAAHVPLRVPGRHGALDVLVRGEIGGRAGPIAREGHARAAEDAAQAAGAVELAYDVEAAAVLRLLARLEGLLALDL